MSKNNHSIVNSTKKNRNLFHSLLQVLFLSILYIDRLRADLPVHCLRSDVIGLWTLKISTRTFTPSLENEMQTSCGHGLPNKVIDLLNDSDLNIPDSKEIHVNLKDDYKIYENGREVGTWSFVYDQSFILYYKNAILTAPFKYYKNTGDKEAVSNCSKTFLGWYIPDAKNFKSNWSCFYGYKENGEVSAVQSSSFLQLEISLESKNLENSLNKYIEDNIQFSNKNKNEYDSLNRFNKISFVQTNELTKTNTNLENFLKYEHMSKIVDKLNKLDLGWKADVHPQYVGMSFAELKHKLGLNKGKYTKKGIFEDNTSFIQIGKSKTAAASKKSKEEESVEEFLRNVDREISLITIDKENKKTRDLLEESDSSMNSGSKASNFLDKNKKGNSNSISNSIENCKSNCVPHPEKILDSDISNSNREKDSSEVTDYNEVSKYLHSDISSIDEKILPKNWDWRNVGGESYVPPVRSQGSCGSCYVFSTMTSLESRLRVQTNNKDQTLLSKQFPLACNFYSEGCDGGYPVLVSKFLQEFEAVPESCFEYTESTNKCSNVCDYSKFKKKYTVSKWGYLGGVYGKTSEADIMKELRARGPMPGNILVHWSFHYYKQGIFSTQTLRKNTGEISKLTMLDTGRTWAKVEHSITLVGYGEENGIKYWIGMNTWGENWGEGGFFRILRGTNESEVETMGDFMNIKVEDRF